MVARRWTESEMEALLLFWPIPRIVSLYLWSNSQVFECERILFEGNADRRIQRQIIVTQVTKKYITSSTTLTITYR